MMNNQIIIIHEKTQLIVRAQLLLAQKYDMMDEVAEHFKEVVGGVDEAILQLEAQIKLCTHMHKIRSQLMHDAPSRNALLAEMACDDLADDHNDIEAYKICLALANETRELISETGI